jgi:hypothetical protein
MMVKIDTIVTIGLIAMIAVGVIGDGIRKRVAMAMEDLANPSERSKGERNRRMSGPDPLR